MAHTTHEPVSFSRTALAQAAALCALATLPQAWAQNASPTPGADAPTLKTVTVSTRTTPLTSTVSGFGDEDLSRTPLAVKVIDASTLSDHHVRRMSDVLQLDASATDAYNAIGYWDYVTLRGFVLDARYNFRRDGLPISAETSLGLENRERIELLKGTSGIQAGTSAPGGLVNHVIKRPTEQPLRTVKLEANNHGNVLAHVDLGGRFGTDNAVGYRLNVAAEDMKNHVAGAGGHRELFALAMDWRLRPGSLLEVDLEHSRRSQPGVPGLSLTGNTLPAANPYTNINSQPWSQPGVMSGLTGSVRYEQALSADWSWQAHASRQSLKANDFLAYPYGCYAAATDTYYADRYCPNGDFDLYDYRSLNERRVAEAIQWQTKGKWVSEWATHHITAGILQSRQTERGQPQADNNYAVGTGNIYTLPALPADATFGDPYTNRTERSTEVFAYDHMAWSPTFSTWMGLRHSRIGRDSVRTDGSRATSYTQRFTTPWLALAWQFQPDYTVYASTGQGIESDVAPGRSRYTNAGQPLAPLKSKQWELGVKSANANGQAAATLFGITRPHAGDAGTCDVAGSCTRQMDGDDRHTGLELSTQRRVGPFTLDASAMWLSAQRRNSTIAPELNGQRPTNVPTRVVRLGLGYAISAVPGLSVQTLVSHEGRRNVLPDGSLQLPAWTKVDLGLKYQTKLAGQAATWRLGVQNAFNRRFFKESPYQYSHIYLFPAAPRTVVLSLEAGF